jgi:hypothetical protein
VRLSAPDTVTVSWHRLPPRDQLDNTTYQARIRIGSAPRQRRDRVATIGAEVPVRIRSDNPDKVAIDAAALEWS